MLNLLLVYSHHYSTLKATGNKGLVLAKVCQFTEGCTSLEESSGNLVACEFFRKHKD